MREVLFGKKAILTRMRPEDRDALRVLGLEAPPEGALVYTLRDGAGLPRGYLALVEGRLLGRSVEEELLKDAKRTFLAELEREGMEVRDEGGA